MQSMLPLAECFALRQSCTVYVPKSCGTDALSFVGRAHKADAGKAHKADADLPFEVAESLPRSLDY